MHSNFGDTDFILNVKNALFFNALVIQQKRFWRHSTDYFPLALEKFQNKITLREKRKKCFLKKQRMRLDTPLIYLDISKDIYHMPISLFLFSIRFFVCLKRTFFLQNILSKWPPQYLTGWGSFQTDLSQNDWFHLLLRYYSDIWNQQQNKMHGDALIITVAV